MKRAYIAGPYSLGDTVLNVRAAVQAADAVFSAGYYPYLPHLTAFWHLLCPRDYADWLRLDLHWLEQCHYLIRLPGESSGADRETMRALELEIPVYLGLERFLSNQPGKESP